MASRIAEIEPINQAEQNLGEYNVVSCVHFHSQQYFALWEAHTQNPNRLLLAQMAGGVFFLCHWMACIYYLISEAEGFDTSWTVDAPSGEIGAEYL